MSNSKKILLSGVKPTGRVHIGNYFGAMKQFVELQNEYESYVFIADYHAVTTVQNKEQMSQGIIDVALDYLAIGLDPKKVVLFKQSDVPQVHELNWIFNCITTMPYLMLSHAFKSQVDNAIAKRTYLVNPTDPGPSYVDVAPLSNNIEIKPDYDLQIKKIFTGINVGLFDYPLLMAADILLQDADVVPVGQDQKQHVEYARDTAQKFNNVFSSKIFKLPEPLILESVETVPGTDGRKMSKSYGNVIPLFASYEEIKKAVMSIPTDSKGVAEPKDPETNHIFNIHKLLLNKAEKEALAARYKNGRLGYKEAKDGLIEALEAFIKPMRERRAMLANDLDTVFDILKAGGSRASSRAEKKMAEIRKEVGVDIY